MSERLTLKNAQTVAFPPPGEVKILWDPELPGFGLRVMPTGAKSYFVKYRHAGRQRWMTIGKHGAPWTPETARRQARLILGDLAKGSDPAEKRDQDRKIQTLGELSETYLADYATPRKKPSSLAEDRRNLKNNILPTFGTMRLDQIKRTDVARWHKGMSDRPGAANRALALLKTMLNLSERWGYRPEGSNPARHIELYPEKSRERFLTPEEMGRLGEALAQVEKTNSEPQAAVTAIRLLILTGARLSEILTLEWKWIDLGRSVIRLPDSKTGAKTIPLGAPVQAILSKLPRVEGNPYVLPALRGDGHFIGIQKCWQRIRIIAGIPDVRIHDLRHSFASVAVAGGNSLYLVGKVLGHRQASTTERYAHITDNPLLEVAEKTSKSVSEMLGLVIKKSGRPNILDLPMPRKSGNSMTWEKFGVTTPSETPRIRNVTLERPS